MSWQNVDEFNTRQETVKCVVVGDTAVGKTRLICARACNAFLSLPQIMSTHIPTVWAIDQYRIHKEVLRRSWMIVDGVNVSLRLWDTFGDHEKDRKFAYGRSDVVMLCFSISSPQSFKHCKTKWYSEIRQYCPEVPIVLVGCKNDLRHICRDDRFLELCKERSPFFRLVQESDLVTREQGRQLAKEIGAYYYESSVLTHYGVDTVFENAVRLALIARRQQRFWVKSLKNVTSPILQMPYRPPQPREPETKILPSTFEEEMHSLLDKEYETDVNLMVGQCEIRAHKITLAAASSHFKQLFISLADESTRVVTLSTFVRLSPRSVQCFLRFLYTGDIDFIPDCVLDDFIKASTVFDISELKTLVNKIANHDLEDRHVLRDTFYKKFMSNLKSICLHEQLFDDVVFKVDDGACSAHRSILMARCAVMKAMFGGHFRESRAEVIPFPGVTRETFVACLYYLYTDSIDDNIKPENCLAIIELANRLCLPRLVSLIELDIVQKLSSMKAKGINLTEKVFKLLEPCQVHNAYQLSEWCQYYIICNYHEISTTAPKLIRSLHQDNQAHLNKNRWPPLYFLKEQEFYDRCVREQEQHEKPPKCLRWKAAKKKFGRCFRTKAKVNVSRKKKRIVICP
ncbi:unnamed protein product [Larinioides sclopetarius]|uniref:BTB domain-containing protein n=1 Tax=Larinioides sclopetarius TaxID=280406 RepID=A0AAV1YRS6_9ARAC